MVFCFTFTPGTLHFIIMDQRALSLFCLFLYRVYIYGMVRIGTEIFLVSLNDRETITNDLAGYTLSLHFGIDFMQLGLLHSCHAMLLFCMTLLPNQTPPTSHNHSNSTVFV